MKPSTISLTAKTKTFCAAGAITLIALAVASLFVGKYPLSLEKLLNGDPMQLRVFLTLRLSRTVVGVIGCGVDIVYPLPNRALFADTEHYGCILSEYPPGTPPNGWNFPKRNRIISGLSCGVLVVEAPEKSGALITARQAADQGRDVFAVPGNIDMDSFVGSNRLLREGGILASTGWDILSEYEHQYPGKLHRDGRPVHQAGYTDEVERIRIHEEKKPAKVAQKPKIPTIKRIKKEKEYKKVIDNGASSPYSDVINKPKPAMSQTEQTIVEALKEGERLVDDVIAESGLPSGVVLSTLTLLEVKGMIRRLPGRHVCLSGRKS